VHSESLQFKFVFTWLLTTFGRELYAYPRECIVLCSLHDEGSATNLKLPNHLVDQVWPLTPQRMHVSRLCHLDEAVDTDDAGSATSLQSQSTNGTGQLCSRLLGVGG